MEVPWPCHYLCKNTWCICGGFASLFFWLLHRSPLQIMLGNAFSASIVFPKMALEFWDTHFVPAGWSDTCGLKITKLCVNLEFKCYFVSSWFGTRMQNFKSLKKKGCLANICLWRHQHNYLTTNAETKFSVLKALSEYFVVKNRISFKFNIFENSYLKM